MPTNLDGLKAIYEALGGQADDVTSVDTNADMLMKIAALIAAGAAASHPARQRQSADGQEW